MKENKVQLIKAGIYAYLILITMVIVYFASKLWREELWPNERFTIVVICTAVFTILLMAMARKLKNTKNLMIIYHIALIFTVLVMMLPYEYRPVMALFMIITYIAGLDAGLTSALCISVAISFLYGAEQEYLYGTLIIGAFSCFAADKVKNKLRFIVYAIVFAFISFFINGIFQYYKYENFDYKFAFISLAAVVISLIIFMNVYMIMKPGNVEQYIKEDSELMTELKNKSLSLYYHSAEVAELALRGALAAACDERLAYGGGMLHDIGKIRDNSDYVKAGLKLANEYGLPREVKSIIVEHNAKHRMPSSKEAAIVMLADSVISSIEYLKATDKEVSERKIIDNVFNVRLTGGALDKSGLSVKEFSGVKKAFMEYYNL